MRPCGRSAVARSRPDRTGPRMVPVCLRPSTPRKQGVPLTPRAVCSPLLDRHRAERTDLPSLVFADHGDGEPAAGLVDNEAALALDADGAHLEVGQLLELLLRDLAMRGAEQRLTAAIADILAGGRGLLCQLWNVSWTPLPRSAHIVFQSSAACAL